MAASSGAIRAGKAFVEMFLDDKQLRSGLARTGASLKKWGAIGLAATGPILALFAGTISAASDLQETMNKFNVVFGDQAGAVKAWGDNFAKTVGRSKKQVADFLAGSQDLFVPLGFEPGAATDLSKQITGLAIDLASFNNTADEDALRDLHAALTGSGEVMKKYGVIVSEAAVKQQLLNRGLDPTAATEQQKVQARLNIIMAGTTAAQGDAIRSAGGFANQMKALKGAVEDAAAAIGEAILPAVTEFISHAVEIAGWVGDQIEKNPTLVKTIFAVAAAIGAVSAAVFGLGVAMTIASANPIALVLGAIAGAAVLAYFVISNLGDIFEWLKEKVQQAFQVMRDGLGILFDIIKLTNPLIGAVSIAATALDAGGVKAAPIQALKLSNNAISRTVGASLRSPVTPAATASAARSLDGDDEVNYLRRIADTNEQILGIEKRGGRGLIAGVG